MSAVYHSALRLTCQEYKIASNYYKINFTIFVPGEHMMLVKGAETAVLDRLASGPKNITLDHVNEYAEVCVMVKLPEVASVKMTTCIIQTIISIVIALLHLCLSSPVTLLVLNCFLVVNRRDCGH